MKVKQVVGEHKKGFRAKKYARKPKNTIAPKKPEPIKPQGPVGAGAEVKETAPGGMVGKVQSVNPNDGTVNIQSPDGNTQTVQQTQLQPGENNKLTMQTPKIQPGQEVDSAQTMEETPEAPYFVDTSSGTPMAKTTPRPTAIVASKLWTAITPDIEAKAHSQGFRKVTLQANGKTFVGLEGGDQKLGSKIIVAPADYSALSAPAAAPVRESDTELARWKQIAGL